MLKPPTPTGTDADETKARGQRLDQIGHAVAATISGMLQANYDCDCINCRNYVAMRAVEDTFAGEDLDSVELVVRMWVKHLLKYRKLVKEQVLFQKACEEAGALMDDAADQVAN